VNGNKFLLDTNIVLYIAGQKIDIDKLPEGSLFISFITELEVLSYPLIVSAEEEGLKDILLKIPVININDEIKAQAIKFRKRYNLKLPEAIIVATAFVFDAALITNDKGFSAITELQVKSVELKNSRR